MFRQFHSIFGMSWDSHLRLRHVRVFLEIARSESVSVAAQRLHVTQPAVSRSLKELEEMLGIPLFDRVGRGLRLNEAGRVFQSHSSAALVELLRAGERLTTTGELTSKLSVGVLPTAATDLVPRTALTLRSEAPQIRLRILTGPNWLLFNQLRDGQLDIVVGRMPESTTATGVTFQQLYIENVVLVCRPLHPILEAAEPEVAIPKYPLILPPSGAVIAQTVDRFLTSLGLPELRGDFETVALPVGRKIVALSDALWFISRGVVADELAEGRLVAVPLSSPLLSGPVGMSVSRAAQISLARSEFERILRNHARQMTD